MENKLDGGMVQGFVKEKVRGRRPRLSSVNTQESPHQKLLKLNVAVSAVKQDDVRRLVSCISDGVDVTVVYDLMINQGSQTGTSSNSRQGRIIKASLLHLAILHRAHDAVKLLLHLGAPVEGIESSLGERGLHVAVKQGHYDIVISLLQYGACINSCNNRGDTPLHIAARSGQVHITRTLLDHGAQHEARNKYGLSPWYEATIAGTSFSKTCADLILTHFVAGLT